MNDRDVSCQIERHEWVRTPGVPEPEEGADLGGMSGAPMITIVQGTIVGWRLAGVVYQCSRELAEIVKAVRADFIAVDGSVLG